VSRACKGIIFTAVEQVQHSMAKTHTSTGLKVVVNILNKVYATGRKVAEPFKDTMLPLLLNVRIAFVIYSKRRREGRPPRFPQHAPDPAEQLAKIRIA